MAITLGTDGYCEVSDIQGLHQQRTFSTTTSPTTAQVETQIAEDFGLINGFVDAAGYTIPVAVGMSPKSGAILKRINTRLTASWTEEALYTAGIGGIPGQSVAWYDQAMALLAQIQKGILILPDAATGANVVTAINEFTPEGGFNLDDAGDERGPVFTMQTEW